MSGTLQKVKPGDPLAISAGTFNTFVDAAQDYLSRRHDQGAGVASGSDSGLVLIRNDSGGDRSRYDVLGIDGVVFTPIDDLEGFQNRVVLKGSTPASGHEGKFTVLAEPVASGDLARAYISGLCAVQLNVVSADHKYADITAGQTGYLTTAESGAAQILYAAATSGTAWSVVRIAGTTAEATDASSASGVVVSSRLDLTASGSGTKVIDSRDWRMQDNLVHMWVFSYIDGYNPTTPEVAFLVGEPMGPMGSSGYGWPSSSSVPFYDLACPFFCGNNVSDDEWRSVFEYNGGGEFLNSMFRFQINTATGALQWDYTFQRGGEGDVHLVLTVWGGAHLG
ncbi:MAG: hypothetical protein LLG01_15990 [Planctomycetaceae bacterium]|nr:hypothetical protein [Planctomycetaceae bacterium]